MRRADRKWQVVISWKGLIQHPGVMLLDFLVSPEGLAKAIVLAYPLKACREDFFSFFLFFFCFLLSSSYGP